MSRLAVPCCALVMALLLVPGVHGALVTTTFTGRVTQNDSFEPQHPYQFTVGEGFTLVLSYDPDNVADDNPDPTRGSYYILGDGRPQATLTTSGGFSRRFLGQAGLPITVVDGPVDSFYLLLQAPSAAFELRLSDPTGRALSSDALPTPADFARLGTGTAWYDFDPGIGGEGFRGTIAAVAVPEPATWAGGVAGLAIIVVSRAVRMRRGRRA